MKIGILGGTFNPPHIGHLVLAQEVMQELCLDKVIFIPTNIPPHKENQSIEAMDRINMVKAAISDNDKFDVSDMEIIRGGISYTVDTIEQLKNKFQGDDLFFILGSELANTFNTWKDFERLKDMVNLVVAQREFDKFDVQEGFKVVRISQLNISSSYIREFIKNGKSVKYKVPGAVLEYINSKSLYRGK